MRTDLIKPLPVALREHAARFPGKVAFADDRRAVTYGDLEARTRRLAGHLASLGVRHGDRVAICLGNTVSTVESYLAIVRAGGVGVPLNPPRPSPSWSTCWPTAVPRWSSPMPRRRNGSRPHRTSRRW